MPTEAVRSWLVPPKPQAATADRLSARDLSAVALGEGGRRWGAHGAGGYRSAAPLQAVRTGSEPVNRSHTSPAASLLWLAAAYARPTAPRSRNAAGAIP